MSESFSPWSIDRVGAGISFFAADWLADRVLHGRKKHRWKRGFVVVVAGGLLDVVEVGAATCDDEEGEILRDNKSAGP